MRRLRELRRDRVSDTLSGLQPTAKHYARGVQRAGADRADVGLSLDRDSTEAQMIEKKSVGIVFFAARVVDFAENFISLNYYTRKIYSKRWQIYR